MKYYVDDTVPNVPTNNRFLETNFELKRRKCFDNMLGSDGKQQGKQNINISRCIFNQSHLPMFWLMMETQRLSVLLKVCDERKQ